MAGMKPKHWSYSSLSQFEQCPRSWKYKNIDKMPAPKGPGLERGIIVHEMLEHALRGSRPIRKHEFDSWLGKLVKKYRALKGLRVEESVHVDRQWEQVRNQHGYYIPPGTWATGKLDMVAPGFLGDWKTGGVYLDKHEDQAELYALMLTVITGIATWDCDLIYTDHQHVEPLHFDFSDPAYFEERKKAWTKRALKIFSEKRFPKKPGRHCSWCPYHEKKGGPCDGQES